MQQHDSHVIWWQTQNLVQLQQKNNILYITVHNIESISGIQQLQPSEILPQPEPFFTH